MCDLAGAAQVAHFLIQSSGGLCIVHIDEFQDLEYDCSPYDGDNLPHISKDQLGYCLNAQAVLCRGERAFVEPFTDSLQLLQLVVTYLSDNPYFLSNPDSHVVWFSCEVDAKSSAHKTRRSGGLSQV